MLEIADEVVLDLEIALVHRRDERQLVHVGQRRPRRGFLDVAIIVAVAEAGDLGEVLALCDVADREIVVLGGDEIDRLGLLDAPLRIDGDVGANQSDLELRVDVLERARRRDVGGEGRRRRMHDDEVEVFRLRHDLVERDAVRRRVDQFGIRHHGGKLGEPGRIPMRLDLALGLIARPGAAVEALEGGSLKKERTH